MQNAIPPINSAANRTAISTSAHRILVFMEFFPELIPSSPQALQSGGSCPRGSFRQEMYASLEKSGQSTSVKIQFRVGALVQQEIAQAHLAAGADEQVDVGLAGGIQEVFERSSDISSGPEAVPLHFLPGCMPADHPPGSVVERQVEVQAGRFGRCAPRRCSGPRCCGRGSCICLPSGGCAHGSRPVRRSSR